jgi:hypothetical protein
LAGINTTFSFATVQRETYPAKARLFVSASYQKQRQRITT